jgi:DNA gyrase/topoisomerase IV subunit B
VVAQRLRETALLNPGLEIVLIDDRDGRSATFRFKDGLADFVSELLGGREALTPTIRVADERT